MKIYFTDLNFYEKILVLVFKRYTYKIYKKGYIDGFNMKNGWYFCKAVQRLYIFSKQIRKYWKLRTSGNNNKNEQGTRSHKHKS